MLYSQITPVQPQPIFLIPANSKDAVADITVAACKDHNFLSEKQKIGGM